MFQLDKLKVHQPQYVNDLPKDAPRWIQGAPLSAARPPRPGPRANRCARADVEGYEYTMVSGVMTFIAQQPTGSLPGGLVRNPRSLAAQQKWAETGEKPVLRPYEELMSAGWDEHGVLAGSQGEADEDRGVDAALAAKDAGASALARLDREMRKKQQQSKL